MKLRSFVVDRLDPGAVHRDQLAPKQVEFAAQQHERAEDLPEGMTVVAAEVGNGLEVGLEVAKQPDHLNVPPRLCLQAPAGADPIEVAVDVELEQISGRIARPTCYCGLDPSKAGRLQVEPSHEGLDEAHRMVRADVVVDRLRQE